MLFAIAQGFALTIETDKIYTIKAIEESLPYMADNQANDNSIELVGSITAATYWKFESTGKENCYYIKNYATGRYIQGYSECGTNENPVKVYMGTNAVEYQIESKLEGRLGFSCTSHSPHDFNSGTWGLNPRAEHYVQVWGAVSPDNKRSFWTIELHPCNYDNGICTICGAFEAPAKDASDYYLLDNAGKVEWLSGHVSTLGGAAIKVKMTEDIDFEDITHNPIGWNDGSKFCGEFDGQYHRVLNLKNFSQTERVGFFGGLRGGSTVKNLIIDKSCEIKGSNYVGGIAGSCQAVNNSKVVVENCINEAYVYGTGYHVGGIIGGNRTNDLPVEINNCGNSGMIKADDSNSCAVIGWGAASESTLKITNFWNTGKIVKGNCDKLERDGHAANEALEYNFFSTWKDAISNVTITNCYDASESDYRSQGTLLDVSTAHSGELCYKLGGPFTQDLSQEGYPTFGSKAVAAGKWFNDTDNDVYYNEENGNYIVYQLNLSEENTVYNVPANVTATNISVARTIPAGQWIGLCLPFDYDIPSGWDVREMTGVSGSGEEASMKFTTASTTTIEAGKPYIVKPTSLVETITATNKEILTSAQTVKEGDVSMIGNFGKVTLNPGVYYINTSSQLKKLGEGYTANLKGFRAYFTVDSGSGVKALSFDFDDATGISLMEDGRSQMEDGAIYNVAGQRLNKMQKGINIVNGKKILK